jgi:hypothetical protein
MVSLLRTTEPTYCASGGRGAPVGSAGRIELAANRSGDFSAVSSTALLGSLDRWINSRFNSRWQWARSTPMAADPALLIRAAKEALLSFSVGGELAILETVATIEQIRRWTTKEALDEPEKVDR